MPSAEQPSRRTLLTAAVVAAAAGAASPAAAATDSPERPARGRSKASSTALSKAPSGLVDNRAWTSYADWRGGAVDGTRAVAGVRPGLVIAAPAGTRTYADPHTKKTALWEYATWTSPVH